MELSSSPPVNTVHQNVEEVSWHRHRVERIASSAEAAQITRPAPYKPRKKIIPEPVEPPVVSRPDNRRYGGGQRSSSFSSRRLAPSPSRDLSPPSFHHDSYDRLGYEDCSNNRYESQPRQPQQDQGFSRSFSTINHSNSLASSTSGSQRLPSGSTSSNSYGRRRTSYVENGVIVCPDARSTYRQPGQAIAGHRRRRQSMSEYITANTTNNSSSTTMNASLTMMDLNASSSFHRERQTPRMSMSSSRIPYDSNPNRTIPRRMHSVGSHATPPARRRQSYAPPVRNVSMGSSATIRSTLSSYRPPSRMPPRNISNNSTGSARSQMSASSAASAASSVASAAVTYVEIEPGVQAPLRRSNETVVAISNDYVLPALCFGCTSALYCIADAQYMICPLCRCVSPLMNENADGSSSGHGVGMGFTKDTMDATKVVDDIQEDPVVPTRYIDV